MDRIVRKVRQSEEWEVVEKGIIEIRIEQGMTENLIKNVETVMKNFSIELQKACEGLGRNVEVYENAKQKAVVWKGKSSIKIAAIYTKYTRKQPKFSTTL